MKPKWQKLAWPRKYSHSSFSSLVQYLLPKDTLLRTYLNCIKIGKMSSFQMNQHSKPKPISFANLFPSGD